MYFTAIAIKQGLPALHQLTSANQGIDRPSTPTPMELHVSRIFGIEAFGQ